MIDSQSGREPLAGSAGWQTLSVCSPQSNACWCFFGDAGLNGTLTLEMLQREVKRKQACPWPHACFQMWDHCEDLSSFLFFIVPSCSEECLFSKKAHILLSGHTHRCNHAVCSAAKAKCTESARSLSNLQTYKGHLLTVIARAHGSVHISMHGLVCVRQSPCVLNLVLFHRVC